jgi:hypothetical protein
MKAFLLLFLSLLSGLSFLHAKVWRVNNQTGISANFTSLGAAFSSSTVLAGDTIYLEGSSSNYSFVTLNKRLVIIGPGYFLSDAGGNLGLQFNTEAAKVSIAVDSLASGSEFHGLQGNIFLNSNADNIKMIRCNIVFNLNSSFANSRAVNIEFRQCYVNISFSGVMENLVVTNCIINGMQTNSLINGLIRNNTVPGPCSVNNSYISNNIFLSSVTFTNCTIKNNLSNANNLPATNNNQVAIPIGTLIINTGSTDGRYMLAASSPARGAGETINGETPDAGAFGTGDPYRLSGIPAIPSIYSLQAPSSVPATATFLTVTLSTRSNN